MITPRILRRSLRSALQWRLLLLWWASLLVPGVEDGVPIGGRKPTYVPNSWRGLSHRSDESGRRHDGSPGARLRLA